MAENNEQLLEMLKLAFEEANKTTDPKVMVAKSFIRKAIGSINPNEVTGLKNEYPNQTKTGGSFGTTPPVKKGKGGRTKGLPAAEDNKKVPIIKNENSSFKTEVPPKKGKGKGKVKEEKLPVDPSGKEDDDPENDISNIEFSPEEIAKIEKHPQGGLLAKLATMSVEEICEQYKPEQLKAIADQLEIELHSNIKKGETIAAKILEHIKSVADDSTGA